MNAVCFAFSSIKSKPFNGLSLFIFGFVLTVWLLQTGPFHESWNESTRLAAIESLVERGTWRIDASAYGQETGDKVLLNGHYYSDKPPLFAAMGAVFYTVLYYGWGARLAVDGCQPGTLCVYYWLTVLMVGVPSALMAVLFFRLAWRQLGSIAWAVVLTALLCFGTIIWPYSLVFNHHLPAAAALFGAFYLLFDSPPHRFRILGAGLLTGFAVMLDLTSFFLALALFLMVIIYNRRYLHFFIGAALIPAIASLIFNYQITSTPLFPYFFSQGYDFPGSQWGDRNSVAVLRQPNNLWLNSFHSLVGQRGMLAYSPLLWFALAGLLYILLKKNPPSLFIKSWLILMGLIGHIIFVLTQDSEFGGDNYGVRYLIPSVPILYAFIIFIVPVLFRGNRSDRFIKSVGAIQKLGYMVVAGLFGVAALVSLFAAYQGSRGGAWHKNPPPFFLDVLPAFPYLNGQLNLALVKIPKPPHHGRPPRHFDPPPFISHRLDVDLNHEVRLLGYDLPTRRVQPGQRLPLTLYWQSLRVARGDYFVFTHLFDANQTRQGGLDRRLEEGYPVKFWYPGEIVTDRRQIPVNANTPNGLVWLRVGGYQSLNGQIKPLPLLTHGQAMPETSLVIGPILIGTPAHVISRQKFAPPHALSISLGQPSVIALRGYNLTDEAGQPWPSSKLKTKNLKLTLYWEDLAPTPVDWSIFVQLRNQANQTIAQKDGPAGGCQYPSSLWQPGEIIADEIVLPVDNLSQATYSLYVGLYDLGTGNRLAVPGSPANEILLLTWSGK